MFLLFDVTGCASLQPDTSLLKEKASGKLCQIRPVMAILNIQTYHRAAYILMRESETDWSQYVIAAVIATVYSHTFDVFSNKGFRVERHEPIWRR